MAEPPPFSKRPLPIPSATGPPSSGVLRKPASLPAASASTRPSAKTRKVLVVEDSKVAREALVGALESEYVVCAARDGQEAMDLLQAAPLPDVVVSDVIMPGMDGLALTRAIKKDPRLSAIPVILVTSRASAMDVVEGIDAGARHYIAKPVDPQVLLARVRRILKEG